MDELTKEQREEFDYISRLMIAWLCNNCHTHVSVIVTPTNAELLEGVCSTGQVLDYVRD